MKIQLYVDVIYERPSRSNVKFALFLNQISAKKTSNWLLRATVTLHEFEDCKNLVKFGNKDLVETQFCAIGYKGADACQGDSGGPVSYTISKN